LSSHKKIPPKKFASLKLRFRPLERAAVCKLANKFVGQAISKKGIGKKAKGEK
jgi:hypothetical protein